MADPSFELEKLRIATEAETKKEEIRSSVRKVIYGTMIVGLATAAFPFVQKVAESVFAERIESIRRDKEIEILTQKNRLEEELADKKYNLDIDRQTFSQDLSLRKSHREFLQSLADEGRSNNIEERIILAEFYSFLAEQEEDRKRWTDFKDHLYAKQERLNEERKQLIETTTSDSDTAEQIVAQTRLEQIQRLEDPSKQINKIQPNQCDYTKTGVLEIVSVDNHKIKEFSFCESPNHSGNIQELKFIVLHYSASSSLEDTVKNYLNPAARQSAHIVIGRDGTAVQIVPFNTAAWHAGRSEWKGNVGLNRYSIGIDMINAGRLSRSGDGWQSWFGRKFSNDEVLEDSYKSEIEVSGWHKYTPEQMRTLTTILKALLNEYGLSADSIIGHEDISPGRKTDPGPAFPMNEIREKLKSNLME